MVFRSDCEGSTVATKVPADESEEFLLAHPLVLPSGPVRCAPTLVERLE